MHDLVSQALQGNRDLTFTSAVLQSSSGAL
jgi:hypothetical protein